MSFERLPFPIKKNIMITLLEEKKACVLPDQFFKGNEGQAEIGLAVLVEEAKDRRAVCIRRRLARLIQIWPWNHFEVTQMTFSSTLKETGSQTMG